MSADPPTDSPPIDAEALARLEEWGGERLLQQMIRLFLDNSPERISQIREGFETSSVRDVERGAHSLKSSAANVGAMHLSRIAADMEEACRDADGLDLAVPLEAPLTTAHTQACDALRTRVEDQP